MKNNGRVAFRHPSINDYELPDGGYTAANWSYMGKNEDDSADFIGEDLTDEDREGYIYPYDDEQA